MPSLTFAMARRRAITIIAAILPLAACSGDNSTTPIDIAPDPPVSVASVHVTPDAVLLYPGQERQLSAVARDSNGNPLPDRAVTWSSSAPDVIGVNAAGLASALTEGTAVISATSEGVSGAAMVEAGVPSLEVSYDTTAVVRMGVFQEPAPRVQAVLGGAGVEGYPIEWSRAGDDSGWLFPMAPVTDADGFAEVNWAPGAATVQTIMASGGGATVSMTHEAEPLLGKAGGGVWVCDENGFSSKEADGYRVTLNAGADPYYTFYAAIQAANTYFGYQVTRPYDPNGIQNYFNNPNERLVIFSVWDAGDVDAELLEAGVAECRDFEELGGFGVQCTSDYPWDIGKSYTFELEYDEDADGATYTAFFTDESTGERMMFARVRVERQKSRCFATWIEDFGPPALSCLDLPLRDYSITDPFQRIDGVWEAMSRMQARSPVDGNCSNHSVTSVVNGVRVTAGGDLFQAPFEERWWEIS